MLIAKTLLLIVLVPAKPTKNRIMETLGMMVLYFQIFVHLQRVICNTLQNKFTQKKEELLSSQSAPVDGETNSARQPSQVSEMDIWMMSVGGKKKGRVADLGSLVRSVRVPTQSTSAMPEEVNEMIKTQVQESNVELYNQLQEERRQNKEMRRQNKKMSKELGVTNKKLDALLEHLRYPLPSDAQPSSSEDSQSFESDENNDPDNLDEDEFSWGKK